MLNKTPTVLLAILLCASSLAAPVQKNKAEKAFKGWIKSNPVKLGLDLGRKSIADIQTGTNTAGRMLFHVIGFQNGGYAVVAAEDRIEPIIAFSDSGVFAMDPQAPIFAMLVADLSDRLGECDELDAQRSVRTPTAPGRGLQELEVRLDRKAGQWKKLVDAADADSTTEAAGSLSSIDDVRVNVLVATRWNQSSPENAYTPNNYVCGCVATAMSQLMRYHAHPVVGIGTNSNTIKVDDVSQTARTRGGDGAGGPYNWGAMPNWPTSTHLQVGALTYDAGVSVGMSYKSDGSAVDTLNAAGAFMSWFKYASAKKHYTGTTASETILHDAVNANLDAAYPVLLGITGTPGGHAVVCDGYGFHGSIPYHHINMGWAGASDAWYNLPDIASFDRVYKVIYNVFPNSGGAIISGRVFGADGYPLEGIAVEAANGSQTFTATSNAKGIYHFAHVPQGSYTVTVSEPDMISDEISVSIGSTTVIDQCPNTWGVDLMVSDSIFTADADAHVLAASPAGNYGASPALAVCGEAASAEAFLRFDLSDLADPMDCAELRLTVEGNPGTGLCELYLIDDDTWTEAGITYDNRPVGGIKIADIAPIHIPATNESTVLIGGALRNGNLDDDAVVTDAASGITWSTKVADTKYYIAANPAGSGYYNGWTLSRLGAYIGGNNTIGMLTYAHPTCFDSGTTPDFCAFANSGGVQLESDPVAAVLAAGDTLAATFKVSSIINPATFSTVVDFIFDKGLPSETTVSGTPAATSPLALVTFNGTSTAYAGTYSATCTVPGDYSTIAVRVGVQNTTSGSAVSLDDIALSHTTTGITLGERELCIDVSDAVLGELAGNGMVSFCLRGTAGLVEYGSRESDHAPKLVVSQMASTGTAADWETDGNQPDGQWTYGYYPQYGPYTDFVLFPLWKTYYPGSQSWIGGNGQIWDHPEGYPRVGRYAMSPYGYSGSHTNDPTPKIESVKRWTSDIKGVVRILNDLQRIQASNDGCIARIRKNGTVVWSHDLGETYRTVHELELSVYPGDVVDFAVDPIGNHSADWIYWRARITTLPRTANRSGLVAHYDFDEAVDMPTDADGDQYDRKMFAFDYSGNGNHGTLANADTWSVWKDGMIGNAIDLDGVDDAIATPVALNPADGPHAVAAWIKGGAIGQTLVGQAGAADWIALESAAAEWRHLAVVWDATGRKLYVDGAEVSSSPSAPAAAAGMLAIGAGAGAPFSGMIDDLGIWSRALSECEVYSMYQSGLAGRNLAHAKSYPVPAAETDMDGDGMPDAWETAFFGHATNATAFGDADGDCVNNLCEYAFGGNPTNAGDAGTLPMLGAGTGQMEFIYLLRDDPALTARVLTRTNLLSGTWGTNSIQPGAEGDGTFTFYTNNLPAEEDSFFIKLMVE